MSLSCATLHFELCTLNLESLLCPAKVNLALSVGPPDADGLHPLASWMIALRFGDRLTLERREGDSVFDLAWAEDAPSPGVIDWPLEKDLAFRAHRLVEQRIGRPLPVALTLRKVVPTGAGLGGGSSDAAAVMVGLNRLFELNVPTDTLIEWSMTLGSDVGFLVAALNGMPSAIVTGKGETVEPQPLRRAIHLVLILPPFGCPTGQVYQTLDRQRAAAEADVSHLPDEARVQALTAAETLAADAPFNDLAAPACAVQPRLAELVEQFREVLGVPVHITGSGAAMFVIARDETEANEIAATVTRRVNLPAVATRTL